MSQSVQHSSHFMSGKEPWLAVNLSMFFPGIGQLYSGYVIKGCIFIVSQIILYILGFRLINISHVNSITGLAIFYIANALIILLSLFDAYQCVHRKNNFDFETMRKGNKDAWYAVFLSRLIPGLGHLYIGKKVIGFPLLVVWGPSLILPPISIVLMILSPFVIYHAYISSPVQRENSKALIISIAILSLFFPLLFLILFFPLLFLILFNRLLMGI